jgi:hypothetical protein
VAIGWHVWTVKKFEVQLISERNLVRQGPIGEYSYLLRHLYVCVSLCIYIYIYIWFTKFYFPWYMSLPTRNIPTKCALVNLKAWDWGNSNTDSHNRLGNYPLPKREPVAWVNWLLYWRFSGKIYYALLWELEYTVLFDSKVKQFYKLVM